MFELQKQEVKLIQTAAFAPQISPKVFTKAASSAVHFIQKNRWNIRHVQNQSECGFGHCSFWPSFFLLHPQVPQCLFFFWKKSDKSLAATPACRRNSWPLFASNQAVLSAFGGHMDMGPEHLFSFRSDLQTRISTLLLGFKVFIFGWTLLLQALGSTPPGFPHFDLRCIHRWSQSRCGKLVQELSETGGQILLFLNKLIE